MEKKFKVTLKNVKHYPKLSDETNAFSADVYINGDKIGTATDDGRGGEIDLNVIKDKLSLVRDAERYYYSLPEYKHERYGFMVKTSLLLEIGDIIDKDIEERSLDKQKKKLERDIKKGICYGELTRYEILYWKGYSIEELLKLPKGRELIKMNLSELKKQRKNVLNTNIPKELY